MIQHYLKAGYPTILMLTQEPHRAEVILPFEGFSFLAWDCLRGFRQAGKPQVIDEIRDPVEAINKDFLGEETARQLTPAYYHRLSEREAVKKHLPLCG